MDRQQLQRHVDELRQELDRLPADAPGRERLQQLVARIDAQLDEHHPSEPQESFQQGMQEAVTEFEADHPRAAALLRRFVDTLSSMGI
ncbi:MAG: DUF4404 family protein [Sinimarinibacterium flocculans]|jgi:uncharacterized alpha-E superfamily protein|uniref:Uncharacterized protein DUF4404 n=1 Tax=Sinimarinibacterium flocculans TaxID=985250 RepID=A0A318EAA3_9GAMM|nr:DUF4404 family protein [Sinimarinibacterium flocculans]MEC9363468.1 DUF4404 family protein [Pseudomonadota bacterium]PXV69497.1 uncharacterized protein DUF4404 [Sinimarinibacterium flocculans]